MLKPTLLIFLLSATAASAAPTSSLAVARDRATAAVQKLSPDARVSWRPGQPGPASLTNVALPAPGADLEARARGFVDANPALVGVPAAELELVRVEQSARLGRVTFAQRAGRLSLDGQELALSFDKAGRVIALSSTLRPVEGVREARFDAGDALEIARRAAPGLFVKAGGTPVAIVGPDGQARPAVRLLASQPTSLRAWRVTVDLFEGAVVGTREITKR